MNSKVSPTTADIARLERLNKNAVNRLLRLCKRDATLERLGVDEEQRMNLANLELERIHAVLNGERRQ